MTLFLGGSLAKRVVEANSGPRGGSGPLSGLASGIRKPELRTGDARPRATLGRAAGPDGALAQGSG